MHLTPREKDKLLVAMAAEVARKRLKRGVKLNHPEAVALITDYVVEGARDGRSVADLMRDGGKVLRRAEVMDGVAEMIHDSETRLLKAFFGFAEAINKRLNWLESNDATLVSRLATLETRVLELEVKVLGRPDNPPSAQ